MVEARERGYRPIRDYALIGGTHTAALVGLDGSIDWCCWPVFDAGAVLCRLLDAARGGYFRVGPAGPATARRAYEGRSAILATTFDGPGGALVVRDFMPLRASDRGRDRPDRPPIHWIVREVECLAGEVAVAVALRATFDFGRAATRAEARGAGGGIARAGEEQVAVGAPDVALRLGPDGVLAGRLPLRAGDRRFVILAYGAGAGRPSPADLTEEAGRRCLDETRAFWRGWSSECRYDGPYAALVERSAMVLELLTYDPTGAIVAAPTTSLPEELGGSRNWDYRFSWLRDSGLTIHALESLGYRAEARDFYAFLASLDLCARGGPQILYRIDGRKDAEETELPHLDGYRSSRPVRVGNLAARQLQLDVYGEVLDAIALYIERFGDPAPELPGVVRCLAGRAARRWCEQDHGIWEFRDLPRHFTYSKLMCWVALDRALRIGGRLGIGPREMSRWRAARGELRREILERGWNGEVGAFTQFFGGAAVDAAALMIPVVGFLPADDPRVLSTVRRVEERLLDGALVHRYRRDDGLPGVEGAFFSCAFWLACAHALAGSVERAREVFERAAALANDVGLLSEEAHPRTGELLGNFPQGFTHLALIRAALTIDAAERRRRGLRARPPQSGRVSAGD